MHGLTSETAFRSGLVSLVDGDPITASHYFATAIALERQKGVARPQMRYLSYYGLSQALAHGATPHAIRACELASRRDVTNANLLLNLSRVYLLAGKTTRALATLELGIRVAPDHRRLHAELRKADRRQRPPIPFASRDHPINMLLGRLFSAWRTHAARRLGAKQVAAHHRPLWIRKPM